MKKMFFLFLATISIAPNTAIMPSDNSSSAEAQALVDAEIQRLVQEALYGTSSDSEESDGASPSNSSSALTQGQISSEQEEAAVEEEINELVEQALYELSSDSDESGGASPRNSSSALTRDQISSEQEDYFAFLKENMYYKEISLEGAIAFAKSNPSGWKNDSSGEIKTLRIEKVEKDKKGKRVSFSSGHAVKFLKVNKNNPKIGGYRFFLEPYSLTKDKDLREMALLSVS